MKVIQATAKGMCFGVKDAVELAMARDDASDITIWGDLVHNEEVLAKLTGRGFSMVGETDRNGPPKTPTALITAHGVSDKERARLVAAGKELIDTTCPLVRRVHDAAARLDRDGWHVVVLGREGHVEVRGLVGDLEDYRVVGSVEEVATWDTARIGIVCQTTFRETVADEIVAAIRSKNPDAEVLVLDTICDPTKQRVLALEALLPRCDAVVVVGGATSNNTKQLARFAEERGVSAFHVQGPGDLNAAWFEGCEVVGLTAGTSTLDWTIAQVHHALVTMARHHGGDGVT